MTPRLMCDVDGVLADFNSHYVAVLNLVSGKDIDLPEGEPSRWDYAQPLGFTHEEETLAWEWIKRAGNQFWQNLPALPHAGDALYDLDRAAGLGLVEVYFITTRPGERVKRQTEEWLADHGFDCPTVIPVAGHKGALCRALGVTDVLDDKPENVLDIRVACPEAMIAMPRTTWNRTEQDRVQAEGVVLVPDAAAWVTGVLTGVLA